MKQTQTPCLVSFVGRLHYSLVFGRRSRVLSGILARQLPAGAAVLDIGCGNGTIARLIADSRPDISIEGVETTPRANCLIPCRSYDGQKLPFQNQSFDVCLLVDVLHHTDDIVGVLGEASRVSRCFLFIKDHLSENALDYFTLKSMDWFGNRPHNVRTPFNYQSHRAWKQHFANCNLIVSSWTTRVPLYAFPVSLLAGRGLHFVSLLQKA